MAKVKRWSDDALVEVKVGDCVGFKCDIEQYGYIVEIRRGESWNGGPSLVLENKNGFSGDYIGRDTITTQYAQDCWID